MRGATEYFLHHADQTQGTIITHAVVDAVGILAGGQNTLVAQDGKMLGNIALGSAYIVNDILYANFPIAQDTQDFQTQWM